MQSKWSLLWGLRVGNPFFRMQWKAWGKNSGARCLFSASVDAIKHTLLCGWVSVWASHIWGGNPQAEGTVICNSASSVLTKNCCKEHIFCQLRYTLICGIQELPVRSADMVLIFYCNLWSEGRGFRSCFSSAPPFQVKLPHRLHWCWLIVRELRAARWIKQHLNDLFIWQDWCSVSFCSEWLGS